MLCRCSHNAGWNDIQKGYEGISDSKQKVIDKHVVFKSISGQIMPGYRKTSQDFYFNLANVLRNVTSGSERPDLICFCRGGGKPEELYRLNNADLCRSIVTCPIPVCSAVGHSTDKSLWIKQVADFKTDTPSKFVMFLYEVMEKAGLAPKPEPLVSQPEAVEPNERSQPKNELPAYPGYGAFNPELRTFTSSPLGVAQTSHSNGGSKYPASIAPALSDRFKSSPSGMKQSYLAGAGISPETELASLKKPLSGQKEVDVGSVSFIAFCAIALVFFIVIFNIGDFPSHGLASQASTPVADQNKKSGNGIFDLYHSSASYYPSGVNSPDPSTSSGQSEKNFSLPPTGAGTLLNTSQIAWCLKEKMRIETMEADANISLSPRKVDYVNHLVDNYNSRCSSFRYAATDMDKAKRLIELSKVDIKRDAIDEIKKVDESKNRVDPSSSALSGQLARSEIKPLAKYEGSFANAIKTEPKVGTSAFTSSPVDKSALLDLTDRGVVNRIQKALSGIYKWIPMKGDLAAMHYSAIHDFQERNGLPVSNKITRNLLSELENAADRRNVQGTEKIFLDFDSPKYVMKAQGLMQQVGYSVPYTGYIDQQTESAIRDFQSKNGVKISGKVGPYLIQQLENKAHTFGIDDPIAAIASNSTGNYNPVSTTAGSYATTDLSDSLGGRPTTKRIQQALSNVYKWIPVKGELAAMHYAAIHDFQERNGLLLTNQITPSLVAQIEGAGQSRELRGEDKIFLDFDSYDYILRVQRLLRELGYQTRPTGYLDYETESDIRDFQSKNGVKVSGKVGPFLIQKLEEKVEAQATMLERRSPGYKIQMLIEL